MIFGSVCSGIEAASCAWHPLGWRAAFLSEIEAFPRAVLSHHYPGTPLHGDFTTIQAGEYGPIDLLVGGTPCQSFSVAGLRGGMADERGNLALEYLRLADRLRPRWLVWENVPGVLSSNGGRDFGSFLGGLVQLGYGFAYRVLDAQFFGLAQRRKRVFVVGYLGDWRRASAVLFEPASLRGHSAPSREKGEVAANSAIERSDLGDGTNKPVPIDMRQASRGEKLTNNRAAGSGGAPGHGIGNSGDPAFTVSERGQAVAFDAPQSDVIQYGNMAGPLDTDGHSQAIAFGIRSDASRNGEALTPSADAAGRLRLRNPGLGMYEQLSPTLDASAAHAVAWSIMPQNSSRDYKARRNDVAQPVMAGGPVGGNQGGDYIQHRAAVRRLTPRECERLQGFPDDYTLIPYRGKPAADGPRYRALGNSMAVPVMAWIGRRIEAQHRAILAADRVAA